MNFFAFKMISDDVITVRCLFANKILQFCLPWNVQHQLLCIVLRVISVIIVNKPNDLIAHPKPIYTMIVFTCTTYALWYTKLT